MSRNVQALYDDAMSLPPADRAALVDRLVQTLDEQFDPQIEAAWADEIECRLNAYDRGQTQSLSAEQVWQMIRSRREHE